jgi:hypothetical protein
MPLAKEGSKVPHTIFWGFHTVNWWVWISHGGNYKAYYLLGSDFMKSGRNLPMFRRNILPSSSGSKSKPSNKCFLLAFSLNRDQLRWVVGLFTGHCRLNGHLFKLGLADDPTCERCLEDDESAAHILCDCEAIAYLRFRHLDQFFYGNKWLLWHPHKQSPTFHSKCRIDNGLKKRESGARAGLLRPTPYAFIRSFSRSPCMAYSSTFPRNASKLLPEYTA